MSEVLTVYGGRVPGAADPQVVETLERLLADAREGRLIAIGYATVTDGPGADGGGYGTGWDGAAGTRYKLGCAVAWLSQRYIRAMHEDG